jgi:hypothetical protein
MDKLFNYFLLILEISGRRKENWNIKNTKETSVLLIILNYN